jgi:hypothetical protein
MAISNAQATKINKMNRAAQDVSMGTLIQTMQTDIETIEGIGLTELSETVTYDQFTDGGAAVGTFVTSMVIPAGATVLYSAIKAVVGFAGDTSATIQIGDGTTVARYSTGTPSVFTTAANGVSAGAVSGTAYHTAEKTVKLTITTATDWTAVSAGSVTVSVYYLS